MYRDDEKQRASQKAENPNQVCEIDEKIEFDDCRGTHFQTSLIAEGDRGECDRHLEEDWLKFQRQLLHPVNIKLTENDQNFEIRAEVPGFDQGEIEVSVNGNQVILKGEHQTKTEEKQSDATYSERAVSDVFRTIALPAELDAEKVTVTGEGSVFNITVPKRRKGQRVRISTVTEEYSGRPA